ncbi:MAG: acyltransferase family protein [Pseudomonadota bacterium]
MTERIDWLDIAKAISIALVVMMHATLGVGDDMGGEGFMHAIVAFAQPFRIPAFFLLAGLLAARATARSWSDLVDRKVMFYAYFYVLWVTIQFAFKAPLFAAELGWGGVAGAYFTAFIEPFGTLWFIAVLPLYFAIAKAADDLPTAVVLAGALIVHLLPIHTGWLLLDGTAEFLIFFLLGHRLYKRIFDYAEVVSSHIWIALGALVGWAVLHQALIGFGGFTGVKTVMSLAGAAAVIAASVVLSAWPKMDWARWIGQHTLVIYLAFFLPMVISREALVRLGVIETIGVVSLLVWLAAMIGPVIGYLIIKRVGFGLFLFERPAWFSINTSARPQPAE